jgi:HEAT repeat protein
VTALRDSDPPVRTDAAETLAALGRRADKAYTDVLRASAEDDGTVRQAAERYLQEFGRPPAEAAPALIALAGDAKLSSGVRLRSLVALGHLGPEPGPVVPAYFACLDSPDAALRERAVRCLGALGRTRDPAVLPRLLATLNDPIKSVQDAAAEVIEQTATSDVSAQPALLDGLKSDSVKIRTTSLACLARMGKEVREAAPEVSGALRDRVSSVRLAAAETLFAVAPERFAEATVLLGDRDKEVRKSAAAAFRKRLEPARCFEVFADELSTTDEASRVDLANALDQIDLPPGSDVPTRTKVRLSAALSDVNAIVRVKAAKALQRLDYEPEKVARVLDKLLSERGDGVSRQAAETLIRMGATATRPAAPDLLRLLDARDAPTRKAAAAALRSAGPLKVEATANLIAGLADPAIHNDVGALLSDIGEAAVGDLMRALESKDAQTRRGAARALGMIGPKAAEAYQSLIQHFRKDPDPQVRQEADTAMGLIRQKK